jgi:hypothetical protein
MDLVEMRVSPDGQSVAVRSENAEDAWNAWAIMHRRNGGHFGGLAEVRTWQTLILDTSWAMPEAPLA